MAQVAFIGLGNMGAPMAANLAKAGHTVSGFDVFAAAREAFAANGGAAAGSLHEAVTGADVVITMLPSGREVESVVCGEMGVLSHAKNGALLIDCSTIDVTTARAVSGQAVAAGFQMCDAPVSGGVTGAAAGTLTFMVGGAVAAFEAAKPVLDVMGKTIVHAGDAGAGQAAKICNNMVLGISMIAVSEAFNLADRLGLDRQKLFDISSTASGQCWSLTTYCPVPGPVPTSPANRDYQPGFTAKMMLKDLHLAEGAADSTGAQTPLGKAATRVYESFCEGGGEAVDFSGVIKHLRRSADEPPM